VALSTAAAYASGRLLARRKAGGALYQRGAVIADGATPSRAVPAKLTIGGNRGFLRADTAITLAGLPVARDDETKHFKIIGTTGTGKSTAIREILSAALERGDRAVIADPDGGYLRRFYDPGRGDVILNPFEPESVKWNLLGEIANDYDIDQMARSLITDNGDPDRSWSEYARTFFIAVTRQVRTSGITDDREVYRLLAKAPVEELKLLLAGTVAGPFLEEGNERMFGSVRSTASSAVRVLEYTTAQEGTPFSIRQWVRHSAARRAGGSGGALFLPYRAGEIAALRSIISAWMRLAIFEAMGRDETDQRLWFVVDELDALGEIDGLKDALSRLRKFGGRCLLGFQSIGQVSGTYGRAVADTIVENCGNTLILRCSASERGGTSEFASKLIGQQQVVHTTRSRSRRPNEFLATTTTSEHLSIEPAVMASEIERLPDLAGFLKLASIADWRYVRLTPVDYPAAQRSSPDRTSDLVRHETGADG
jgi:type IV secretory pathway TraG/TraD family ATPase VirD4